MAPITGPRAGGTAVTITGANLGNVTTVKFGGTVATFTIVNEGQINAVSPAYAITGVVDVTAASTYGIATAHGAFTYT